ncbi:uncharacterized protein [Macrobrachium rosenbergii]|uniref:uncharacterized protein n=1 Tax=Macrobrachium rosenbergii TaxID=79674 RepID=UPI0034D76D1D
MARCTSENWKYQLPWVLLGLRTAPRADGTPSAAEKTYGESLVVPGELVTEDRHNPSLQRLHDVVGKFAPCKRMYTDRSTTFTLPGLPSTTHVFVRDDAVRPPLTRPYRGPFRVLERNNKAFLLALPRRNNWVSIDWLKPTLLEEDTDVTAAHPLPGCPSPQPRPASSGRAAIPGKGRLHLQPHSHTHRAFPHCPHAAVAPFNAPADMQTDQTFIPNFADTAVPGENSPSGAEKNAKALMTI